MAEKVKVISEKYNDKDILQLDSADLKKAVEKALAGEIGNIQFDKLPQVDMSDNAEILDNINYFLNGNIVYNIDTGVVVYPYYIDGGDCYYFALNEEEISLYLIAYDSTEQSVSVDNYPFVNFTNLGILAIQDPSEEIGVENYNKLYSGRYCLKFRNTDDFTVIYYVFTIDAGGMTLARFENGNVYTFYVDDSNLTYDDIYDGEVLMQTCRANLNAGSNPETLETLKVGDTFYKVTALYKHTITIVNQAQTEEIRIYVVSVYENSVDNETKFMECIGKSTSSSAVYAQDRMNRISGMLDVGSTSSSEFSGYGIDFSTASTFNVSILNPIYSDTVTQL